MGKFEMKQFCAVLILLYLCPKNVDAEVFSWTDKDGVTHFTNIPRLQQRDLRADNKRKHVYFWRDPLGSLRRIYRVDVRAYDSIIQEAASYYDLPFALVKAVVAAESAFDPKALSSAGAQGLMQLMPQTAFDMQVRNPFQPRANIFGGTRYLRFMANRFDGDVMKTLAAYNAGPLAVEKYLGVPPYPETVLYVRRAIRLYTHYLEVGNNSSAL